MKRILCAILAALMCLSMCAEASAHELEESPRYGLLPVQFEGVMTEAEYLDVMYLNGVVYALASDLADNWGYEVREKEGLFVALRNKDNPNIPWGMARFSFDTTEVIRTYATQFVDTYESPAPAVSNEAGTWIPLEYTVNLMNAEMLIQADANGDYYVHIVPPRKCIGDVLRELSLLHDRFMFDWSEDFAYTDDMIETMADASNIINLINGCLALDGVAWVAMFQQGCDTADAMDAKYGDELAILMCANSQKEAREVAKMLGNTYSAFSSQGLIADTFKHMGSTEKGNIENTLKEYVSHLEAVLADTNTPQADSNRMISNIKESIHNLNTYEVDGTSILTKLDDISNAVDTIQTTAWALEFIGYALEYDSQDDFSVQALSEYLNHLPKDTFMPEMMKDVMIATTESFKAGKFAYSAPRMLVSVATETAKNGAGAVLGTPAVLASFAWDVSSNILPGLSDALDAADKFQLSLYASILQYESMVEYVDQKQILLSSAPDSESITKLAQYCYVYLKSCYVTRDAGVAALDGIIPEADHSALQKQEDAINEEIAEYMVLLKTADESNEGNPLGFLPADNEVYLANHDETNLAKLILLEPYASYLEKIGKLEEQYGEAVILTGNWGYQVTMLGGLCYIKLVDFDMNGVEELVTVYKDTDSPYDNVWTVRVYGYDADNHEIIRLYKSETAYGGGVGGNHVSITQCNGQYYMITGHAMGYGIDYDYVGFKDGDFTSVRHIGYDDGNETYSYEYVFLIDGEVVSDEYFHAQENLWQKEKEDFYLAMDIDESKLAQAAESKAEIMRKGKLIQE